MSASSPGRSSRPPPPGAARLAPPTPTAAELAALLEQAELVIGGDTGPVHLAAALGRQVLALHGPTDPRWFAPWSSRTGGPAPTVCSGAARGPRPLRAGAVAAATLAGLGVEEVFAAARALLPAIPR